MAESMDITSFDDLVHQSEQLTATIDGESDLPRVERNLKQLVEAGQQLWLRSAAAAPRDTSDVRASVLLGTKGYDLHKVSQQLDTLSSKTKKVDSQPAISETDIKGFLKNERENAIISIIEEVRQSTIDTSDRFYWSHLDNEWEEEKMKILNSLIEPGDVSYDGTLEGTLVSTRETSSSTSRPRLLFEQSMLESKTKTAMNMTESVYAREIVRYVENIVQSGVTGSLSESMYKLARDSVGEGLIIDMWEMILFLLSTNMSPSQGDSLVSHRCSTQLVSGTVRQARVYLEMRYRQSLESTVCGDSIINYEQGSSSVYNLVKNYLNAKSPAWAHMSPDVTLNTSHDGTVEGHSLWLFVWHCLRAGSVDSAVEALHKSKSNMSSFTNEFISILREYSHNPDNRLCPKSEQVIRAMYKKSVRLTSDVYKRTIFSLLGCCGINELQSDIFDKVDDYLWLRLGQIHYDSDRPDMSHKTSDSLCLAKLQSQISDDMGESYFNAFDQPLTYFKVLFLTAQWELAIDFLFKIDRYRCHALHIAIVLNESGLLLTPTQHINVPILSKQNHDPPNINRLNYARIISIYTKKFEHSNFTEAIYYFYLLRNHKSTKGDSLFIIYVSNLVRETKNFDTLLGYMNDEGYRLPGIIDKFQYDVFKIINQVALDCETNGFFEHAIKLYDLESKHDKVLELLTKILCPLVPERKTQDSKRTRLELLAVKIAERYCSQGHNASKSVAGTFYLLLDLMTFFDYYHSKQYTDALDTITKLNLFPFKKSDIDMKVNEFGQYAEEIKRNIPDLLLATMNILYAQYKELKSLTPRAVNKYGIVGEVSNTEKQCSEIKQKARSIITYSGMIPYRMSGDTNARLVQLETHMN